MGELVFIGLGLAGIPDLTRRGLEATRDCDKLYAEFYTSRLLGSSLEELETFLGRKVQVLSRAEVEAGADSLLDEAKTQRVGLLTAGDPMTATTHLDLQLRAQEQGIRTRLIHGISIQTAAAGAVGLHSYKFGRTTTLVFPEPSFRPTSPYEVIRDNKTRGLHTLVLLDLRAEENRYMSAAEGVRLLLEFEAELQGKVLQSTEPLVACARIGSPEERIVYAPAAELARRDLGPPLHCLIVPGSLHFTETQALRRWANATV